MIPSVDTLQRGVTHYAISGTVLAMRGRPPRKPITRFPNRIREIRLRRGLSQQALGEAANIDYRTVGKLERGETRLKVEDMERLAPALGIEPSDLHSMAKTVPVVGYVGAGAQVFPIDDHAKGDGLADVRCPPGLDPDTTVAVQVKGDSMWPLEDGWVLFYSRAQEATASHVVGKLCIVKVANDGPTLVKHVRRAPQAGHFNLISSNAPPLEDVELDWASPVRGMLPPDVAEAA